MTESNKVYKTEFEVPHAPKETLDFIKDLGNSLYNHLPESFQKKMEDKVKKIILGAMPIYMNDDVGAYQDQNQTLYLSSGVLYEMDPHIIAEVFFHEFGHPLLNDEVLEVDTQISADFLAYHSLESPVLFIRAEYEYDLFKSQLTKMLGDNEQFVKSNRKLIQKMKDKWYPTLEKEIKEIEGINLPKKLELDSEVEKYARELYPFDEMVQAYEKEDNPLRRRNIYKKKKMMEKILKTPVKDLSGYVFNIPRQFAKNIERKCGVFVGYSNLLTPKNEIEYNFMEILERNLEFNVKHPLS